VLPGFRIPDTVRQRWCSSKPHPDPPPPPPPVVVNNGKSSCHHDDKSSDLGKITTMASFHTSKHGDYIVVTEQVTATTTAPASDMAAAVAGAASAAAAAAASLAAAHQTQPSYYRRPLPEHLTPFASPLGRILFREALDSQGMEAYFALAEQFITQSEPAYCGLGSLAMVLNALGMDPRRTWKPPWRWYTEELLECCISLDVVKERGMVFSEFASVARCHGSRVMDYRAKGTLPFDAATQNQTSPPELVSTLDLFRKHVVETACGIVNSFNETQYMVVSFDRGTLGQTGIGHFSPVGGYHRGSDMVLILDVARFKYPPYWVHLPLLWEAMQVEDEATQRSRGYFLLSRTLHESLCPVRMRGFASST